MDPWSNCIGGPFLSKQLSNPVYFSSNSGTESYESYKLWTNMANINGHYLFKLNFQATEVQYVNFINIFKKCKLLTIQ